MTLVHWALTLFVTHGLATGLGAWLHAHYAAKAAAELAAVKKVI